MISLRDYAAQRNISYEAVRKQVVRYAADLEGHIKRENRTQLLDEEAVAYLDARRQASPVVVYQQAKDDRIEELEDQVKQLLAKTAQQADRISELAEWKAENALLIAGAEQSRLALQAAQEEKIALQRDYAQATEALEQMREEAHMRLQEAEAAEQRELEAQQRAEQAEAELAAYKALPWYKKIFG